jgi:hypothetical protein
MSNKTAVMKLYDMLDEGQISEIAEIKEYFLMLEQEQIERAWMDAEINLPTEASARAFARKYYEQTYSNDRQYNQYTIDYER